MRLHVEILMAAIEGLPDPDTFPNDWIKCILVAGPNNKDFMDPMELVFHKNEDGWFLSFLKNDKDEYFPGKDLPGKGDFLINRN